MPGVYAETGLESPNGRHLRVSALLGEYPLRANPVFELATVSCFAGYCHRRGAA